MIIHTVNNARKQLEEGSEADIFPNLYAGKSLFFATRMKEYNSYTKYFSIHDKKLIKGRRHRCADSPLLLSDGIFAHARFRKYASNAAALLDLPGS